MQSSVSWSSGEYRVIAHFSSPLPSALKCLWCSRLCVRVGAVYVLSVGQFVLFRMVCVSQPACAAPVHRFLREWRPWPALHHWAPNSSILRLGGLGFGSHTWWQAMAAVHFTDAAINWGLPRTCISR